MALLLNIDTSLETAGVSIAKDGEIVAIELNGNPKTHGSFLQVAINNLLKATQIEVQQLDAIAVANGPGSYTGLRVGLSSAKGLAYALNKPLITVSTLDVLALTSIDEMLVNGEDIKDYLFCPLIDARRMEVFTGVYNRNLELVITPFACILDSASFHDLLEKQKVIFSGNGHEKLKNILHHPNAIYAQLKDSNKALSKLSNKKYVEGDAADLAYSEPYYIKDVFIATKN